MFAIQPVRCYTIAHTRRPLTYRFRVYGETVQVDFYDAGRANRPIRVTSYTLPIEEARELYRKLLKQGYSRF